MAKSKPKYGRGTGNPHPVDVHVGARLRQRRTLLGMTQTGLGDAIGLTFQQVQKYERGWNRIGAGRLYDLSRVLDVSVEFFFEDMPPEDAARPPATKGRGKAQESVGVDAEILTKRQTLELVRAYYKIKDSNIRKRIYEIVKTLGAAGE